MKKTMVLHLLVIMVMLAACSGGAARPIETAPASLAPSGPVKEPVVVDSIAKNIEITSSPLAIEYDPQDLNPSESDADMSQIKLQGDAIAFVGSGATVNGSVITITSAGMYSVSGVLNDGQIIIDTADEAPVVLLLNAAAITFSSGAPIYVRNAEKTVLTLAIGTENVITDGPNYVSQDEQDEPNAALFSKDDLTINGSGALVVNANYNNGIASKDDLKIVGGRITVNAVNDGIKGRDSIAIKNGDVVISAGGDGLQANNDKDATQGYISIQDSALAITAGLDGIQAETQLAISGSQVVITSGGGSVASSGADWGNRGMENNPNKASVVDSAKGLKAGLDVTITGGVAQINALDDALHSNGSLTLNGGDFLLASGDDGIHADASLTINGGNLDISQSYEGLESAVITINDGSIHLLASDDGINTSSGDAAAGFQGQPLPGQRPGEFAAGDNYLVINGGCLAIDAQGDGIDSNGPIDMTGGVVLINGPTSNNNGALDYMGTFNISGGFLLAVGSAGMAQAPSASSTQYSVMHNFSAPQAAGALLHIASQDGQEILTFAPAKSYQSVLLSSPELENGQTYTIYSGGQATGDVRDGLYSEGGYAAGVQVASFTIAGMVTGAGMYGGGFPGGPGGNSARPGGRRP